MQNIKDRVLSILRAELAPPGEPLDIYVPISALGADSLSVIELTMEVESEFDITFSDAEMFTESMTAMQIVERIVAKVAK
jgi:acyl carrier protein